MNEYKLVEDVLDKIVTEIEDTGAYEQEVNGNTEFLEGVTYCLNIINKYKAEARNNMTVGELIKELKKYNENQRVMLYSHGRCRVEEQDEILGCYEEEIYGENDNVVEKVVLLYEY